MGRLTRCRFLRRLLAVGAVLTLLTASSRMSAQGTSIGAVWYNDGGDKITRDELRATTDAVAVRNRAWDGQTVHLFGARNEVLGGCITLEAPTSPATNVSVSCSSLVGPGGSTIGSSPATGNGVFDWTHRQIELFYIRYLQITGLSRMGWDSYDERHVPKRMRRPWTGEGIAVDGTGWTDRPDHDKFYPDIAVPLELVPSFSIAAGENQGVWLDIYIPKTAAPGLYRGTVTVSESGTATHSIPVELTVRRFTLPDTPSSKTMVVTSFRDLNTRFFGPDNNAYIDPNGPLFARSVLVRQRYAQLLHRHKLAMVDDNYYDYWTDDRPAPEWLSRLDGSLFTAANGYDGPGVNTGNGVFAVGLYGSWYSLWGQPTQAQVRNHLDAWVTWFDQHAPSVEYFWYIADEGNATSAQKETWAEWKRDDPGPGHRMKSMATIQLPDAAANTPSLDVPTSAYGLGQPEVWQPLVDQYTHDPIRRFWMYNGLRPLSGSFMIDDDGGALRELPWGQYKKGIQRWFYWQASYYNNFQGGQGDTDLFHNAQTFGGAPSFDAVYGQTGWNYANGDGVLLYPGTDALFPNDSYGVDGPLASLRLKHWRRGIQDVDYLALASAIDPTRVQQIVNSMVPKALWEYGVSDPNDPTWVRTDISWPTDPDVWEAARAQLADIIEGLNAPTGLTAAAYSDTQIKLTWQDNCTREDRYHIERKLASEPVTAFKEVGSVAAHPDTGTMSAIAAGLTVNTDYNFRVRASSGAAYSGYSAMAGARPLPIPAVPTHLVATATGAHAVQLTWTDNATGETGYRVERKKAGDSGYAEVAVLGANVTARTDSGLTTNQAYFYRVRAYTVTVYSTYAEAGPVTPVSPPADPTQATPTPVATAISATQIKLVWNDNATNETAYPVERRTGTSGTWAVVTIRSPFAGTGVASYTDGGLTTGQAYSYRLRAANTTVYSNYLTSATATPVVVPGTPSGLTAAAASDTQITLAWNDNATNETGYAIERKRSSDAAAAWTQVKTLPAHGGTGAMSYLDGGLAVSVSYDYRVRASNTTVYSAYSNVATASPLPVPPQPTNLTAVGLSSSAIRLTWTDTSTVETAYYVERRPTGSSVWGRIAGLAANTTAFTDAGLSPKTSYDYRVRAANRTVYGAYSAVATGVTKP